MLLLVMIVLILTGRRSGAHLHRRRMKAEQAGLRSALAAEISALLTVYATNERLLSVGATMLLPARPFFSMYRGNMHRLIGLTPAEAGALADAHAAGDLLDAASVLSHPVRRRAPQAVTWDRRVLDIGDLQRAAILSAEAARAAILAAAASDEAAARRPWFRWPEAKEQRAPAIVEATTRDYAAWTHVG